MPTSCNQIKANAISFLEKMRIDKSFLFRFSTANQPNLIASGLAVMLAALVDQLANFTDAQKKNWADYLNSFQRDDGFFEDEDISDANRLPGYTKERALFHRTRHVLFALATLGYKPRQHFSFLDGMLNIKSLRNWMDSLDLSNFWDASNKIMDLAIFLTYEAKSNGNQKAVEAINVLLDICDKNTNPDTGYQDAGKSEIRNAMAGAMHIFPIFFMWQRNPRFPERIVETTLSLQQEDGLFGYESGSGGEDCLDYDAVNILVNFYFHSNYRREQIRNALKKLSVGIEQCKNSDGGFCCHRRNKPYRFGTFTTEVPVGGSSLWSTYSRILTIAMTAKVLDNRSDSGSWDLGNNIMEIWDGRVGNMSRYHNFSNLINCRNSTGVSP